MAADLTPMMVDAGVAVEQSCSGFVGYVLDFDSMLFEAQAPPCGGFRAFDLAFLAVVALIVISAIRFRHATTRRRLDLARRMVEKGLEPPPELVGAQVGNDLRRGLVLVSTGVGLLLARLRWPLLTRCSACRRAAGQIQGMQQQSRYRRLAASSSAVSPDVDLRPAAFLAESGPLHLSVGPACPDRVPRAGGLSTRRLRLPPPCRTLRIQART